MWKILSTKKIFEHPRITLLEDIVVLPSGHETKYLKFGNQGDGVTVIAKNSENNILLSRQYSHPMQEILWQFPGGAINLNEDKEVAANRELIEETEYKANKLKLLGYYYIHPRRSTQKMFVYLAEEIVSDKSKEKDLEEEIESSWVDENEIERLIEENKILNVHMLAPWAIYKNSKNKIL